ncbi:hypothetical protein GCM10009677_09540 [Sphaerisporangium rubeum]|uniref:DUF4404 family protein n=1 Tax=Sphaerisporangium rubeum TaxID=321317 RepID=A0A7X0MAX3_9ACTN|nr:hypothetical protein [Sphaerisporangium rubeum]MBB6476539.1 hypothetical protein [Sphaerisporangium rubeum]
MKDNHGIVMHDHAQLQADAVAVGRDAKAVSTSTGTPAPPGLDELLAELAELVAHLRAKAAGDRVLLDAADAGEALSEELETQDPRMGRVRALLRQLGAGVEKAGEYASAMASIMSGIRTIFLGGE